MINVYARQIPKGHHLSPFAGREDTFHPDIVLTGNKEFREHTIRAWDMLQDMYNVAIELEDVADGLSEYKTVTEAIHALLPSLTGKRYSPRQIARWKLILNWYKKCEPYEEEAIFCQGLKLLTGKEYKGVLIKGCVSGDWQEMYYPEALGDDFVRSFEKEYFSDSTEWEICSAGTDYSSPETLAVCNAYFLGELDEDIREEITSKFISAKKDDVVLFRFKNSEASSRLQYKKGAYHA